MKQDMWCCNGRVALVSWLYSVGGPSSCSLEDMSGIFCPRLDNENPWWLWRNTEGLQFSVAQIRFGITDLIQESDLQESHIPQGPMMTAQLKWNFNFSNLPVVYHTICLLCWAWGSLALRASSSGSRYKVGHSLRQQTAGDTKRDITPLPVTTHWKISMSVLLPQCDMAARLGWSLTVLEAHPSMPPARARAVILSLRGSSPKSGLPFPD